MELDCKAATEQFDLRKDHLEKAKLIAQLADHRHALKSGEACPLCGGLSTPTPMVQPNPEFPNSKAS